MTMEEVRDLKRPCSNDNDYDQRKQSKNGSASPPRASSRSHSATPIKQRESPVIENSEKRTTNSNKTPSIFESLPVELLEKIFMYSLNVNLPRASPCIAFAVSNERMYRLLILLAFWDNDAHYDNCNWNKRIEDAIGDDPARYENSGAYPWSKNRMYHIPWILRPLGHDYEPLTSCERRALQSNILRCKWCTVGRIRKQLPDLTRLVITKWCVNAGYMLEEEESSQVLEKELYSEDGKSTVFVTKRTRKQPESDEEIGTADKYPFCLLTLYSGESVSFIYNKVSEWILASSEETIEANIIEFPLLSFKDIPPYLLYPEITADHKGLFRGCFTDAHLSFLETIRYSGLPPDNGKFVSVDTTYSVSALQQGIHVAINEIDPLTLEILLRIDDALPSVSNYHNVPPACFRTAAQVYLDVTENNNKDKYRKDLKYGEAEEDALLCFCLLLTSDLELLPFKDPIIRRLARCVGGAFGEWLENVISMFPVYLHGLTDSDDGFRRHVTFQSRYSDDMEQTFWDEVYGKYSRYLNFGCFWDLSELIHAIIRMMKNRAIGSAVVVTCWAK